MSVLKINNHSPYHTLKKNEKGILNFINLNTLWWIKNSDIYFKSISDYSNINFIDGKILSLFSGIKQNRGPTFTNDFLTSSFSNNKKHFFIGLNNSDIIDLSKIIGIPVKKIYVYNPPFIRELEFSKSEINKIVYLLKKIQPSFVWVCVGSPKQEILSNSLFNKYNSFYLNVGAALDFILGKKKEAPFMFRKFGLEWFYRLITDFKYSKKKVWRSFIGLFYLIFKRVKLYSK